MKGKQKTIIAVLKTIFHLNLPWFSKFQLWQNAVKIGFGSRKMLEQKIYFPAKNQQNVKW